MNLPPSPEPTPPAGMTETRPRIDSEMILGGATTVEIDHAGQRYLLRVTRENKLILTK
ncbi:MAG: hemin uptake protein HemP [Betaproteobacteria bacterium HGW-Betaproteobacteria-10]|jgi:hemin uptake protein HemP|nr:MAG: hemin uptake protein HemP [Betaproteobacteria bacterium HGW-Betaproteobacteria-10]